MDTAHTSLNILDFGASGSAFESTAITEAGSNRVSVAMPGDFRPGQQVLIANCHPHFENCFVYGPAFPWLPENSRPFKDSDILFRGFDGFEKEWLTFVLHIEQADPLVFSWLVADRAYQHYQRRWQWQGEEVQATGQWQALQDNVEICFQGKDWQAGQVITCQARTRLVTRIKSIAGNVLILEDAPSHSSRNAVIRHLDQDALEAAVQQAVANRQALFIPSGIYRLIKPLVIKNANLAVKGENPATTILDISDGYGAIFTLAGGRYFEARSLHLLGHTGNRELPWVPFRMKSGSPFWPTANQQIEVKGCAAANIASTETVLFEDIWTSRMASEAFYSHGPGRPADATSTPSPGSGKTYTKNITYHRCRVFDCASNAFNNNDFAENTNILYCHIENVHNAWEGANRFTRFIGNYVRNAHCGSYGNIRGYQEALNQLGSGQAVISGNVFEGGAFGRGLSIASGPTQIVISDNHFVNFSNSTAIKLRGNDAGSMPARTVTVKGNTIDLSVAEGQLDAPRVGIAIGISNAVVMGNQIFVRQRGSSPTTGIEIFEAVTGIIVSDNIIEQCDYGIRTGELIVQIDLESGQPGEQSWRDSIEACVKSVKSPAEWIIEGLPLEWRWGHNYMNWQGTWLTGILAGKSFIIHSFDPSCSCLKVTADCSPAAGDKFTLRPSNPNWLIHHNLVVGCTDPGELATQPESVK